MGGETLKNQRSGKREVFLVVSLFCFVVSMLLHLFFIHEAGSWKMPGFSAESYDTIVPRTFRMKRVEIDPKTLVDEPTPPKTEKKLDPVTLPEETPQISSMEKTEPPKNIMPGPEKNNVMDKPDANASNLDNLLNKMEKNQSGESLMESDLPKGKTPLKIPDLKENFSEVEKGNTGVGKTRTNNFSSLDDLLAGAGVVKSNTAPILMPTDLLFEYDADTLKPAATATLQKLGSLIKKNAQAFFRIEGHTDSFGTEEYNQQLSLRRAEAVKNFLITTMGLDATHISTVGLGKSKLLVPATGSVEQQQLNRRVEIVISVPQR